MRRAVSCPAVVTLPTLFQEAHSPRPWQLLFLTTMRNTISLLVGLICLGAGLGSSVGWAQGFDAQIFRPATSTSGYFSQEKARVLGRGDINAGLTLDFAL